MCNHISKFVRVGSNRVYLCGEHDITFKSIHDITKLDMFIALDNSWKDYLPVIYSNPLFQQIYSRVGNRRTLHNLLIIHIDDQSTYEPLVSEIFNLLYKKMKIGFGCQGGHGRTGWLLARLLQEEEGLHGHKLIKEVRRRWCEDAIESKSQFNSLGVDWLEYLPDITIPSSFNPDMYRGV